MVPSSKVVSSTVHRSYQDYSPSSHYSILFLSGLRCWWSKCMGDPPQPNPLAKSLPVPMGMMVKST